MKRRWPKPTGEVPCSVCTKFVTRAAAVRLNGRWLHVKKCFNQALAEKRAQLDLMLQGPPR